GFVAETNATHVFIVEKGIVETSLETACPEGITRATVLEICRSEEIPCREKQLSLTEVYRADEMFCTGTMGELAPVIQIDGRPIGTGQPGPLTRRLQECYRRRTATEGSVLVE